MIPMYHRRDVFCVDSASTANEEAREFRLQGDLRVVLEYLINLRYFTESGNLIIWSG